MRVIFLQDVPRVGKRHDIKDVNDGYAQNMLFPRKLAVLATPKAIAELELRKKEVIVTKAIQEELLLKNLEELKGKVVTISAKTDDKGHLFSGIHKKEIIEAMQKDHHASISEGAIVLDKPIKQVGEFNIEVLIKGKTSFFKLIIEKI
jgi:large subunit ribosomal protein L9